MALPTSRNRTYVDGTTVVSARDLNELQDYLTILGRQQTIVLDAASGQVYNDASGRDAELIHSAVAPAWLAKASEGIVLYPLPVRPGEILDEVRAYVLDVSGQQIWARVIEVVAATNARTQLSQDISNGSGTAQELVLANPVYFPYQLPAGAALQLEITFSVSSFPGEESRGLQLKKRLVLRST